MKRIFLFMVATLLMTVSSAWCKQRADVVKKVDAFDAVNIVGKINVVYEQGSGYEVRLDNNADNSIDIKVNGSSLNMCPKSKEDKVGGVYYSTVDWTEGVTVYVKAPSVGSFSLAGSGSIRVDRMTAKRVVFNVAGSGSAVIKQLSADEALFSVAGSGKLNAYSVTAGWANISVAGSGCIKAGVEKAQKLNCSVAGSGNITVSGKAGEYVSAVFGGGSISDHSLKYDKISKSSTQYSNDDKQSNLSNIREGSFYQKRDTNGILSNP